MSNIRDLQKLRGHRNQQIFAQTNYRQNNPQSHLTFGKANDKLPSKSPNKKIIKQSEQTKYSTKMQFHRRGGSFGTPPIQQKNTFINVQNPRLSIYNFSMKIDAAKKKQMQQTAFGQFPLTQRKQRDSYMMFNQKSPTKKNSLFSISPSKNGEISKKMFGVLMPIGKGGFGKVWKVEHKKLKTIFAMKEMSKAKVVNKKSVSSVMNERTFLAKLTHPFIVNMTYAFQDRENLYLIIDYLDGGDLRYHLGNKRYFSEKQTKFFLANIIIGLEYMHRHKIIHRDIKPQNIVLDSHGYLRITDLGISREYRQNNFQDTSGTPGYMAPEVMCRKEHSFTADYFALGVMAYEFMLGRRPYQGHNRKQIKEHILSKQIIVRIDELPFKWSPHAIDFINKLLQRNPHSRLGANGIQQIKDHPWLQNVEWQKIFKKKMKAPFTPISIEEDYECYKQQISEDTVVDNKDQVILMLRDNKTQTLFEGYYYDKNSSYENKEKKFTSAPTAYTQQNIKRR